jgi:hypothetical protein
MKHLSNFEKFRLNEEVREDLYDVAQELDTEDYLPLVRNVEGEGDDSVRIDYGEDESIWLYQNGSVTVGGVLSPEARRFLKSKGFDDIDGEPQ